MAESLLQSAVVALPASDGARQIFRLGELNGRMWVQDTAYYGPKASLEMEVTTYQRLIEHAVRTMQTTDLEKVVLSRIIHTTTPLIVPGSAIFEQLCASYPLACVFHFITTTGEEWLGATPEKLLVKRGQKWSTIALAGTRSSAQFVPWTDKEIHEEHVVKNYIVSALNENGARDVVVSERYERQAGNLVHLAHDITFSSPESVAYWTRHLHPTPAVCGLPKSLAMAYITQHEPHARGFYTGLLGIEHENGDADVYVLLRCARRSANGFDIYAGGGITSKSVWTDEFAETQVKSNIFKDVLLRS